MYRYMDQTLQERWIFRQASKIGNKYAKIILNETKEIQEMGVEAAVKYREDAYEKFRNTSLIWQKWKNETIEANDAYERTKELEDIKKAREKRIAQFFRDDGRKD